jgi:hypothetical protein
MNFRNSVADVASVATFCWEVYKKCKHSDGELKNLAVEVSCLHSALKETTLNDLEGRLEKRDGLGTQSKRESDKMGWAMEEGIAELRQKLVSQTTLLDTFNNR